MARGNSHNKGFVLDFSHSQGVSKQGINYKLTMKDNRTAKTVINDHIIMPCDSELNQAVGLRTRNPTKATLSLGKQTKSDCTPI